MNRDVKPLSAGLWLVPVPIGNARDITLRALDVLTAADVLAAEDTRTLRHLMDIHGIAPAGRPMLAYHDHSDAAAQERLLGHVAEGRSVALTSEAGTPMLADPGFGLVRAAVERGLAVTALPGASALLPALSLSTLPTDRFTFAGFLPSSDSGRRRAIADLADAPGTLCLYESPRRLAATLAALAETLGADRPAAVARELTKRFEEVRRGSLGELAQLYEGQSVKGEIVLMVGAGEEAPAAAEDVEAALRAAMETMRIKDAATAVAGALGLPRREVYQIALTLRD